MKKDSTKPHSRYRTCSNCGGSINRSYSRSGLCASCYKTTLSKDRECPKCNIVKPASDFTPTSVYCKKCLSSYTNDKWKKLKLSALEYKGGRCEICGYNKCNAALEFHHIDINEKEFNISKVRTLSLDKIKPELDKCILLCSNCHREQHQIMNTHLTI